MLQTLRGVLLPMYGFELLIGTIYLWLLLPMRCHRPVAYHDTAEYIAVSMIGYDQHSAILREGATG